MLARDLLDDFTERRSSINPASRKITLSPSSDTRFHNRLEFVGSNPPMNRKKYLAILSAAKKLCRMA